MKKFCKFKRIIAVTLAGCLLLSGCGTKVNTAGVSIVEFDTVEALAAVDRETLKNSENTLYKVGDNYYAFFPSTGQMELVTQVQEYDEQKIKVIETLYNGTVVADGTTTDVNNTYVTSVTTLGSVLDTRTEYLERDLDNCNANMLIDGADTATLTEYKTQLETELQQITAYRQSLSNTAEIVVQSLQSEEVQDELVKQISALLDAQLVALADQYAYNRETGLVTDEDMAAHEQTVAAQQEFIDILQGRYDDIDALLAEKRVTLDSAKDIVDTEAFKSVITQLDTYAASYVAECERLYNNLSTKAEALENLYTTIQNNSVGEEDTAAVLESLRVQYAEMLHVQADLQKQIVTLSDALENVRTSTETSTTADDGVYSMLQVQLDKNTAELTALEEILTGTNLATVDSLAGVQTTLQERINSLEELQKSLKETMTQQQIDALTNLKNEMQSSISSETTDAVTNLQGYIDTLTANYNSLDTNTQESFDALRSLLENNTTAQDGVNDALSELIDALTADLEEQQRALTTQKEALEALIGTATDAVRDDLDGVAEIAQGNSTAVFNLNQDLSTLTDAYNTYTQNNTEDIGELNSSVETLNAALETLDNDYALYKEQTGESIQSIDTLLETVRAATVDNATDVTDLQDAIGNLKDVTVANLQSVQTQLVGEVDTLSTTVTDNYTELSEQVTLLSANVSNLTTLTGTHDTKIGALETSVGALNTSVTTLQTDLTALQTALADKVSTSDLTTALSDKVSTADLTTALADNADVADIPEAYTLPTATASEIGGVCVDNDTIKITSDGKIYVDTTKVNQSTPNETIKVGTVWDNYEDIPSAYRDYCIQVNYVYFDNPPDEMFYKETEEQWWLYSIDESYSGPSWRSDYRQESTGGGYYTEYYTEHSVTYTGLKWCLTRTRPASFKSIEKYPVQVCYYGFDDGLGNTLWTEYAVKFDIDSVKKEEIYTGIDYQRDKVSARGGSYVQAERSVTYDTVTKTYLDAWLGEYETKGPDSGFIINAYKGAYTAGCTLTKAQRQKMWDAGIFKDCNPMKYDASIAATSSNTANYTQAKHCFMNGAAYSSNFSVTNEQTIQAMPTTLSDGAVDTVNLACPNNIYNFTDAGLAYKLAYTYGNHVWIYVGTPN